MRIAFFIATIKKQDGAVRVLLDLVREAKRRGIESVIVTGWTADPESVPVPTIVVPSMKFPLYPEYRFPVCGERSFEKELDAFHPDILHIHSPDTGAWSALKYAKKRTLPVVATHHTDFPKYLSYYHLGFLDKFVWFLLRSLYNRVAVVTTQSDVVALDLKKHGIRNIVTIGWGVDLERFNPRFRSDLWRQDTLHGEASSMVLCVCRLTWEKDLRTLSAAYVLLKEKRRDFRMVVVGDGPARKGLEALMPGAVFTGRLEGSELSRAYASSDVFLFPSTTETFGSVTLEAMASGVIPVVADEGGSKSVVRNGEDGFLARPKDARDFSEKVNFLLDHPDARQKMKDTAVRSAHGMSWSATFERFLSEYQRLTGR
ncbi:glycosyltransferase family 1 protein [Patescibacteria group bacterium]|nr:glycosyltransferase family 1 protein [Patescibacteria group bacterium]MCL5114464.1 glycosyltransferase family 1 protein [Patescibacteria group bacterium]